MKKSTKFLLNGVAPALLTGALAHANTLTGLIPDLYAGLDVVSRELVGFIPSVARDSTAERAAVGENINYPIAPALTSSNITPSMTVPEPTDKTIGYGQMQITKAKAVEFGFVGEEQKGLNNGPGYLSVQAGLFAQALRVLVNEVEADVALTAAMGASRAYGTAGTTPFAADVSATAQLRKILDDNGCPLSERSLVIDTSAGAKMRSLEKLTKANEAGTVMTLRQGELLDLHGFSIKESAGVVRPVIGTNNGSAATSGTALPIGTTVIPLGSAGTGSVLVGDLVTLAGDTNQYQVVAGDASVADGGTITLALPGLRVAVPAVATVITTVARSVRNVGFTRSAIQLVTRAPALPQEGDLAIDRMTLTDPRSGLSFEVSIYPGYRKIRYEVALAWGSKAIKTEHIAALLG